MLTAFPYLALLAAAITQTTDQPRSIWTGIYTEPQATRGTAAFVEHCVGCHTLATTGKSPLVGDPFWKSFAQKTVGDLVGYVSVNMPNGAPGSLSGSTYRDIVAAMLKANGFPAGNSELTRETTAGVVIAQKDGNTELPGGALGRVVGCLAKRGNDWVVTKATKPERAETGPSEEDAARPPGNLTIPLKFVVTNIDTLAGSRVAVVGLLIGRNGAEGINVTAVSRVADKCP